MSQAIIDANIILGHLVREKNDLEKALDKYESLILSTVVVFEVVYILEDEYGLDRYQILEAISRLLREDKIKSERIIVLNSLLKYRDYPKLSFADCYLLELAERTGCVLLTGDKKLARKTITS